MTPEKQRIAIAEYCGWTQTSTHFGGWEGIWTDSKNRQCTTIPDYLNDLNAMNGAEKTLTVRQQHKFAEEVGRIIYSGELSVPDFGRNWYMCYLMMHATAAQRAEAFLRTIGKWEN